MPQAKRKSRAAGLLALHCCTLTGVSEKLICSSWLSCPGDAGSLIRCVWTVGSATPCCRRLMNVINDVSTYALMP